MQSEEQRLIENLFSRLKQAETQSGTRDAAAETLIHQQIQQQPGAPYYMAQAILIQEAAMKKLNERINELESRVAQQPQQSSGGFLAGLFGGGSNNARQTPPPSGFSGNSAPNSPTYAPPPATSSRATGFLGSALQTAVGVAGGVVMADMLTSLFHHSQPEEIVNIINEPPLPDVADNNLDTFNYGSRDTQFNQDSDLTQYDNGLDNDSFDDDFSNDDSFI
ncbi:hypothetical protein ED28_17285 [[Pantoea] beijingensis]|uniref:DUF2076 domain-containing protein n=1 Tax=[Pantoea] beijingensis TaxID=1324864 RepID=A0A443I9B3_9GAMM|nr:DUF2076 domain-containing protein [[Pantoea] beijingensis]RWR00615.1 hypothetical protein ED28_17285 [[Pantoea] beijingensis]